MSTATVSTSLPTGVWNADVVHSTIGFAVRHMVVSTFRGGFTDFDARLEVDGDTVVLEGTVRAGSIDARDANLTTHLLAPDFLDAADHPELRFTATRIDRDERGVTVAGDLTIKGITRPVTATGTMTDAVADPFGSTRLGLALQATIDRREFGIDWNTPLPTGGLALGNEVTLNVDLELVREER